MDVRITIADVTICLGAVCAFEDAGNDVVFSSKGSYILNRNTGKQMKITGETDTYFVDIWVPCDRDKRAKGIEKSGNRFEALAIDEGDAPENDGEKQPVFRRLEEIL